LRMTRDDRGLSCWRHVFAESGTPPSAILASATPGLGPYGQQMWLYSQAGAPAMVLSAERSHRMQ
jgi:hypothetical protein